MILRGQRGPQGQCAACARAPGLCSTPALSSLVLALTCPARPGQPSALGSTAGSEVPGACRGTLLDPKEQDLGQVDETEDGASRVPVAWLGLGVCPLGGDLAAAAQK